MKFAKEFKKRGIKFWAKKGFFSLRYILSAILLITFTALPLSASRISISLRPSRTVINKGESVTLKGKLNPSLKRARIYVYRKNKGQSNYHRIKKIRSNSKSKYSSKIKPKTTARYKTCFKYHLRRYCSRSRLIKVKPVDNITIYGDSRTGHDIHRKIVNLIINRNPEAIFHTGDLVNDGNNADDWSTFNSITSTMRSKFKFYPALGNHENNSPLYYNNFKLPNNEQWYVVEFDNIIFIVLDSNASLANGSTQYNWLKEKLIFASGKKKIIALSFHHPPYSTGPHTEDEKGLRASIVPLFKSYGVDIVFNGHDHNYERSLADGIYYLVVGGGGAPLYDQARTSSISQIFLKKYGYAVMYVTYKKITVKVYDETNHLIDQVSRSK